MKFLIVDHYYPQFLSRYYATHRQVSRLPYDVQQRTLMSESFGTADFYSHALISLGQDARDIVVNDDVLQERWAFEHHLKPSPLWVRFYNIIRSRFPFVIARFASLRQLEILRAQIESYNPDILYIHNLSYLPTYFLRQMKKKGILIVGQIAAPIPPLHRFQGFDLIITSLPHFVDKFKKMGLKAEYLPLCFDPRVLTKTPPKRIYPVTFVGSFFSMHGDWLTTLSRVAQTFKLKIWGSPASSLTTPLLHSIYQGEAWGRDMYNVLQKSQITLNRHSLIAGDFANNMRLFEATGCGAMLLTDAKSNIAEFFVPGKEIVVYHNQSELLEQIKYYSQHTEECARIGQAGNQRTLRDHTYLVRMRELIKIIERNL